MKKTNLPKKIAHIADVHIFNQKRHHEHIYVIDNLAKSLKEENPDLIYIAGDIVDSKAKLSPEQIDVASHFFYRLSNIAPIICIIGNHDANLYIKDKMDSLSPIISEIDSINPIYLLRDSGVYNLYNIDWIVWSRLDTTIPIENYKFGVNYSIGCYHGPVEGAVTDTGWNKFSKTMKLKSFDNCDTVLLGDIHKAQYFKTTKAKNKEYNNCAFSGSLLQVNVGEDEEKGYLIWSYDEALSTYTSTFKPVENKYSIKTIHAKNISEANYKNTQLIRLIVPFETTPADIINIKNSISNDVIIHREKKNKVEIDSDLTEAKVVNEMPSEEEYFANYFKELGLSGKVINSLKKLDKKFANLTENVFIGNDLNEYSLKEIEIKNFLVFGGEASKVNFEEKKGLVGLFGSNGIGKSSLMIAIMFCLFNKTLKDSNKFIKLINDQLEDYSEEIFVKLTLIINGSLWEIKRSIIPKKQSASIRLEVYEYVGGKKTPRHLEDRIQTDKQVLMPLIGNEEVFSTTVLSSQNQSAEFTDKKNSDRLELTNKFLGLDNYAKKYEIANKKLLLLKAENSTLVKNIENFEKPEEIKEKILLSKDVIRENKLALKSLQRNIEEKNEQQKQLQEKINAIPFISLKMTWEEAEELLLSLKKEIKEDLEKIESIKKDIGEEKEKVKEFKKEKKVISEELSKLIDKWKKDYKVDLEDWTAESNNQEFRVKSLKKDIKDIEEEIRENTEVLNENLGSLKTCKENIKILEKEKNKELEKWTEKVTYLHWESEKSSFLEIISLYNNHIKEKEVFIGKDKCPSCGQDCKGLHVEDEIKELKDKIKKLTIEGNENKEKNIKLKTLKAELIKKDSLLERNKSMVELLTKEIEENKKDVDKNKERKQKIKKTKETIVKAEEEQIKESEKNKKALEKKSFINKKTKEFNFKESEIEKLLLAIERKEINFEKLTNNIEKKKVKIKEVKLDKESILENQKKIKQKKVLQEKINEVVESIDDVREKIAPIEKNIIEEESKVKNYNKDIVFYETKLKELEEHSDKLNLYTYYAASMGKKGISLFVLKDFIPYINEKLNETLSDLFDFIIEFNISSVNTLEINFGYNNLPRKTLRDVSLACGKESTLINLVIRAALTRVSKLPKPSLLLLDEQFSMLDKENLSKLPYLLAKLKEQYNVIVMVAHDDNIKEWPDTYITIENHDGKSLIV